MATRTMASNVVFTVEVARQNLTSKEFNRWCNAQTVIHESDGYKYDSKGKRIGKWFQRYGEHNFWEGNLSDVKKCIRIWKRARAAAQQHYVDGQSENGILFEVMRRGGIVHSYPGPRSTPIEGRRTYWSWHVERHNGEQVGYSWNWYDKKVEGSFPLKHLNLGQKMVDFSERQTSLWKRSHIAKKAVILAVTKLLPEPTKAFEARLRIVVDDMEFWFEAQQHVCGGVWNLIDGWENAVVEIKI